MIARSGAAMLPARKSESLLLLVTLCAGAGWIFSKEALGALPPVFYRRALSGGWSAAGPGGARSRPTRMAAQPVARLRHRQPDLRLDDVLDCGAASYHRAGRWRVSHLPRAAVGAVRRMAAVPPGAVEAHRARHAARPTRHCAVGGQQLSPVAVRGGPVLVFGAAAIFAFYFSLNNRFAIDQPVVLFAAMQMIAVGLLALPVSLWLEPWPGELNAAGWTWLALSILIPTCLRFFLQNYAQRLAYTPNGGLIMLMEPVWAAIFSALWYGEVMTLSQVGGALLILLALTVARERHVSA